MAPAYQFLACCNTRCGLRFPGEPGVACPVCTSQTALAATRNDSEPAAPPSRPARPLAVLADNVRSVYNVGSIFRSADGAGVTHVHLAGITPSPTHPAMRKTALGAADWLPWTHWPSALDAANALLADGFELWALESNQQSEDLFVAAAQRPGDVSKVAVILGNEVCGIDPAVIAQCQRQVAIPMRGRKESLNVACAFAVAAYALT